MLLLFLVATGCTSNRNRTPVIEPLRVRGEQVQVDASQVRTATDASIVETLRTACDGPCETLYVDSELEESAGTFLDLLAAAASVAELSHAYLLPPSADRIELDLDSDTPCVAQVAVAEGGLQVWREGEAVRPDPRCEKWDVAVCRGGDGELDLPRLRSLLGKPGHVCVSPGKSSVADLVAIHAALRKPVVRLTQMEERTASLSSDAVAAAVKRHGGDLQWCLDGEVVEEPAPASLQIRFVVHADGHVSRAEVLSAKRGGAQFESCVLDVVRDKFSFDPPSSGTAAVTEIRLDFEPGTRRPQLVQPP